MRVLIVEDEGKIAAFIAKGLIEQGWHTNISDRGEEALRLASSENYDAIVLDIMLPERDGLSILRILRSVHNSVPVILLTARGDLNDRIEGLNMGADDYLAKPFSVEELIARLRAIWRRNSGVGLNLLKVADVTMNLNTRVVHRGTHRIELTPREFSLLEVFLQAPGRILTRTQLCEKVWNYQFDPGTNVVDVGIQRLRRKIDDGFNIKLVHSVRGVGYSFAPKV